MKIFPISKTIHKIDLSGSFDVLVAPTFSKELDALNVAPQSYAIVDFAAVNFVDSAALAALVQSMKDYREKNGELYLVNIQQPVKVIFDLAKMDEPFCIFPTAADALANIHARNE